MKLAEALSVRADLQKKVGQLKSRMKDSAKTQEGDKPVEDVAALSQEVDSVLDKLENLIFRINKTNMLADCDGENLTRLIARRDVLAMRVSLMREVLNHATGSERFSANEIKYVRNIDVNGFRKQTDGYARQLRELDLKIQRLNWTIDLV